MPAIELVLCDPAARADELALRFTLRDTSIARKYFAALGECVRDGYAFHDPDRFYNFPHSPRDRAWIADEINRCIDVVNAHAPGTIAHRVTARMEQDLLNVLHLHFERYRGRVLEPAPFYAAAPPPVQRALDDLNLAIHRYEYLDRHETIQALPQFAVTFDYRRPRYLLADEDYLEFTGKGVFGGWYINHCDVGKPLWDVFKDDDEVVGDANIAPLRYYSGDALVQFGVPTDGYAEYERRRAEFARWWDVNAERLARLGFTKDDPRNAIGSIPVADLDRGYGAIADLSEDAIVDRIGLHQYLARVVCRD
jgi:hypothetical protein